MKTCYRRFVSLFVGVIFSFCLIASTANAGWQIETVAFGGLVGNYTSLAFDASGNPAISYQGNGSLEYANFNGTSWVKTTVDPAGSHRRFGERRVKGAYASLAFDASGNPAISYYDATNSSLKYASFNGTSWDITTVDSAGDVGWYTSLAFDAAGNPTISYYDFTVPSHGNLRYASFNGISWDITTIDYSGNNVGLYTALAFDSSGHPSISYFDDTSKDLRFARLDGNNWVTEAAHRIGDVGAHTFLAFDASGRPAISYYDATNSVLKYVNFNGTSWEITTVDSAGSVGWYTSLAFDASGRPAISYYDFTTPSNGNLRYANFNGTSWDVITVDIAEDVGLHTSLAFDSAGHPAISYQGGKNLKYARFVPDTTTTITEERSTTTITTIHVTSTTITTTSMNAGTVSPLNLFTFKHLYVLYVFADNSTL
jgi:hypothetical protein